MARGRARTARQPGARRLAMVRTATVVLTVTVTTRAHAQPVRGGFLDATVPARGEARLRFGGVFEGTKDQFGAVDGTRSGQKVPLGAALSFDSLGALQLPSIGRVERLLRDSLGVTLELSLGSVQTNVRTLVTRVPIDLEVGVTRRVSLGLTVPIVRTRQAVNLRVNRGGTTGNLGFNPANQSLSPTTGSVAAQQNAGLQQQLATAARRLDSLVANCPLSTSLNIPALCVPVVANRTAASQLSREARTVANGLAAIYGSASATSVASLLVPTAASDVERAVEARLRGLGQRFGAFQVTDLAPTASPAAASARLSEAGFQRIVTDPAFGIFADSIGPIERAGIGDVEAGANFLWLDSFGTSEGRAMPGVRVRSVVGASFRFATGSADAPFNLFDVPTGDGSRAVIVRSATDVSLGRRAWGTVAARFELPMAAALLTRVPDVAGSLLVPDSRELLVDRTPGRRLALELTPRWVPNESFAVAAHYALRWKQADRYTGELTLGDEAVGPSPQSVDAAVLGTGTGGRTQMLGYGVTYSTLAAYARGHGWLPAEISYLHSSTIAGSGGVVPRVTSDQFLVRVYVRLLGPGARRAH